MEQTKCRKAQDIRSVSPDAILHDGTLLALHPGQDRCKKTDRDSQDEKYFNESDCQLDHHREFSPRLVQWTN